MAFEDFKPESLTGRDIYSFTKKEPRMFEALCMILYGYLINRAVKPCPSGRGYKAQY